MVAWWSGNNVNNAILPRDKGKGNGKGLDTSLVIAPLT